MLRECPYCRWRFEGLGNHPGEKHEEGCPSEGLDSRGEFYPTDTQRELYWQQGYEFALANAGILRPDVPRPFFIGYIVGITTPLRQEIIPNAA